MLNGITLAIGIIVILLFSSLILTLLISAFLVPLFKTPKEILEEIITIMNLEKKDTFVDLGSGDGRLVLEAYQQSKCKCIGYDISPIMMIMANTSRILRFPFSKKIFFLTEDIFKIDISNATKAYCYLDEKTLSILGQKLINFIKDGGILFSYKYELKGVGKSKMVVLSNDVPLYIYDGRRGE